MRARLNTWRHEDDYSAQWCNLRRHALGHLHSLLDGKSAYNPVRDVPKFKGPKTTPKWLPYDVIEAVFAVMTKRKSLARLMLIAYAGYRPSEIKRTQPEELLPFLGLAEPFAIKRCGKGGNPLSMPLTGTRAHEREDDEHLHDDGRRPASSRGSKQGIRFVTAWHVRVAPPASS